MDLATILTDSEPTKDTWWVYLLEVAIVGSLPFFWALIKSLNKKSKVRRLKKTFAHVAEIYNLLRLAKNKTRVVRAVILRATNGGGIPVPGKPIYSTIVYEDEEPGIPSAQNRWQQQEVDPSYAKILADLIQKKRLMVKTDQLEKSALKDLYQSDGISYSKVFYIGADEKALIYASFNFVTDDHPTEKERDVLRNVVSRLRYIFKQNSDVYVVD